MLSSLTILFVMLFFAYVSTEISSKLGFPRAVGPVIMGVFFASTGLDKLLPGASATIAPLAQVGLVLLFFYVGMETNVRVFSKQLSGMFLVSGLNTILPFVLGALVVHASGFSWTVAIIIGLSLSVSSVSLSADFLAEKGLLGSRIGRFIIGAGTVDDVIEALLISVVLSVVQAAHVGKSILGIFGDVGIFLVVIVAFKILIIPFVLRILERERSHAALFGGALVITLLLAALGESLGVSSFIGALVAGIIIRQVLLAQGIPLEEQHLANNIKVLAFGFFVPLFSLWVGMQANLSTLHGNYGFAILITVIATVGTVLGSALGIRLAGGGWRDGVAVGFGVNGKGDTELAIAAVALGTGIIGKNLFSAIVFMSVITSVLSPIVFNMLIQGSKGKTSVRTNRCS